ncbi:hypothetical protein ABZ915_31655 [Streptomyces sp. NPDC046915]|uniref:hypothetical protein n=1 Tax=Streptomyces sp. NPDC046915 TaxID=3155257 RepID=UPI00340A52BF
MTVLRIILLSLCLIAVTAQVALNILLVRMARHRKSGTEIIAMASTPIMLVVSFVAAPGGVWLAFELAADAGSAPIRFGYGAVGSVLAAYLAVTLLAAALRAARQRRDRRGCERVMSREETLVLIKSQVIAAVHRSPDSSVTVVYVDNRWADGAYDYRRAGYADPAGWPDYEAAVSQTSGAKSYPGVLLYRPDNANRN